MTEMKLFVCGSLCQGFTHFKLLESFVTDVVQAVAKGAAYRLKVGYPVFSRAGEDRVPGQLLTVRSESSLLWTLLDEFHGVSFLDPRKSLHFRERIEVHTEEGRIEQAMVYSVNMAQLPSTARLILGGNWSANLVEEPPLTEKLTQKQIGYIQRLGRVAGREIIPVELPIYRELMNLEIIVDKGRRLALSKFGHEVFRYLN
jgi:hypothetical protein